MAKRKAVAEVSIPSTSVLDLVPTVPELMARQTKLAEDLEAVTRLLICVKSLQPPPAAAEVIDELI